MNLLILPEQEAVSHEPREPTYAIQLFTSTQEQQPSLRPNPLYAVVKKYVFDDNGRDARHGIYHRGGPVDFTEDIAGLLIRDFIAGRDGCEALLVHCFRGQNRSPAVAIALNEQFQLGSDGLALRAQFPLFNLDVYETLIRATNNSHINLKGE